MTRWLFVVGVALEIAGAVLVSAPLLVPVVRGQWAELAKKGYLYPRGGGLTEEDIRDSAFALVGVALLAAGFSTQLAGYVVEFNDDWLIAGAIGAAAAAVALGWWGARRAGKWIVDKARAHDPAVPPDLQRP